MVSVARGLLGRLGSVRRAASPRPDPGLRSGGRVPWKPGLAVAGPLTRRVAECAAHKRPLSQPRRLSRNTRTELRGAPANERCSRYALFGCGFAAMVVVCLQLNYGVRPRTTSIVLND